MPVEIIQLFYLCLFSAAVLCSAIPTGPGHERSVAVNRPRQVGEPHLRRRVKYPTLPELETKHQQNRLDRMIQRMMERNLPKVEKLEDSIQKTMDTLYPAEVSQESEITLHGTFATA